MESTGRQQTEYCGGASCQEPITTALAALSGKWSVAIIEAIHFAGAAVRFRDLQRRISGISPKELTRHLANLTEKGVLVPAGATGYLLTESGRGLLQHLDALGRWAKENGSCAGASAEPATWMGPLRPCSSRRAL